MERSPQLDRLEDDAPLHRFHNLPACLDSIHPANRSQIPQSTNNKIHVLPHLPRIPHVLPPDRRHNPDISHRKKQPHPLLVRMDPADMAQWTSAVRTDESQ